MNPQHVKAQFREPIVKLCQPQRMSRNSQKAKEREEKSSLKVPMKGLGGNILVCLELTSHLREHLVCFYKGTAGSISSKIP